MVNRYFWLLGIQIIPSEIPTNIRGTGEIKIVISDQNIIGIQVLVINITYVNHVSLFARVLHYGDTKAYDLEDVLTIFSHMYCVIS